MRELRLGPIQKLRDRLQLLFSAGQLRADLMSILDGFRVEAPLQERIEAVASLMAWMRLPVNVEIGGITSRQARLRYLLATLERTPRWKAQVSGVLRSLLVEAPALRLFCQTGLSHEHGLISEAVDRVLRRWLPRPGREGDLAELFARAFASERDAEWIEGSPESVVVPVLGLLQGGPTPAPSADGLRKALRDALVVLANRAATLSFDDEVQARLGIHDVASSPFVVLNSVVAWPEPGTRAAEIRAQAARCRASVATAIRRIEDTGASVRLVYSLEKIDDMLDRIELLVRTAAAAGTPEWPTALADCLAALVRDEIGTHDLRALFRENLHLVARKIVERTGHTGEHYIARTGAELRGMFRSAAGGGALTSFTAVIKSAILSLHLPLFFEGAFASLNYAASFVAMQFLGFTLATKQPSMTASALAARLADLRPRSGRGAAGAGTVTARRRDIEPAAEEIAMMIRSQLVAAVGNVGLTFPVALLLDLIWNALFHHHLSDAAHGLAFIRSLHPLKTFTVPFAMLTGVALWASSIAAGWAENWVVYRQLPQAIAQSPRLARALGSARVARLSRTLPSTAAGLSGNVALGCFLGFVPILGQFFGVPLALPHVTLSSAALALSLRGVGWDAVPGHELAAAVIGIACIGAMNFAASFLLALEVAARAREVRRRWVAAILVAVAGRFVRSPFRFLFGTAPPDPHDPVEGG